MLDSLKAIWKTNPAVRAGARAVVVAVISYTVTALQAGGTDWKSFVSGLIGAGLYAALGLLTPLEPFIGVNKPKDVEVPADTGVLAAPAAPVPAAPPTTP